MVKRHYYNNKDYVVDKVNKVIVLKKQFHYKLRNKLIWGKFGFKKIGGSSIADVLVTDNFKSQFAAFAKMSWLGMPILNHKYIKAGELIEPKVVNALEQKLQATIQTFPAKEYNYDYFANKDDIIGGLPDGYIKDKDLVIEIKTAGEKKFDDWEKFGVPLAYIKQAQLYAYLMDCEKFSIVATFLKEEDYVNPENFPITERKLKSYSFDVDRGQAIRDIETTKKWYKHHTFTGVSPKYDEVKDADLIAWLECENWEQTQALLDKWKEEEKYVE
ncbi:MAGa7180 family putative nuclease [Candidatus Mycoplasma pogonae]